MTEVIDFLSGDRSKFTLDGLELRLRTWMVHAAQGIPPIHALGFSTVAQARRAYRDAMLKCASRTLEASSTWAAAEVLAERIRVFECRRWPRWRHELVCPSDDPVDRALFEVRKVGATIPSTARHLFNLLD